MVLINIFYLKWSPYIFKEIISYGETYIIYFFFAFQLFNISMMQRRTHCRSIGGQCLKVKVLPTVNVINFTKKKKTHILASAWTTTQRVTYIDCNGIHMIIFSYATSTLLHRFRTRLKIYTYIYMSLLVKFSWLLLTWHLICKNGFDLFKNVCFSSEIQKVNHKTNNFNNSKINFILNKIQISRQIVLIEW